MPALEDNLKMTIIKKTFKSDFFDLEMLNF